MKRRRPRLPRILPSASTVVSLAAWLPLGCASAPGGGRGSRLAGDHRPTTEPTGRPRVDGIYERRIEGVGSAGGWRYFHFPAPHNRVAYFVRFYPTGHVHYMFQREPVTTAEAVRTIDGLRGTNFYSRGPIVVDGSRVRFTIGDDNLIHGEGTLAGDELTLRWWTADVPPQTNVFRFVPWP